ncbi:hypothetical protein PR048_026166 [Dryococelus australis]|uniref:Uncharacterized protein n=1 Tax=Dryococelus australis TaxID=614101 RepID=A0ABQ9GKL1_9NEOP|nr:hypothetical protein PR048_026166 [Dryococelus australis]
MVLRTYVGRIMCMEQGRNERAGETGDPQENPVTSEIVQHEMTPTGIEPRSPWWDDKRSDRLITAAPASEQKSEDPDLGTERRLRSSVDVFSIKQDCLYHGGETSVRKETKKEVKHLNRGDVWGEIVHVRAVCVADFVAAEAKYHKQCRLLFASPGRGRPEDKCKAFAFTKLCAYMDSAEEPQFILSDLVETMKNFNTNNPNSVCTTKYLKEKLNVHYGNSVFIIELPGKLSIVNLKGSASSILHDKWFLDKKKTEEEKNIRIVETAADIIRRDIRSLVLETKIYPAMECLDSGQLPETLKTFLNRVNQGEVVERKNTAIGDAKCLHVAPVFTYHLQFLALVYIFTGIINRDSCKKGYIQYAFDNADFNIRTLIGHGTFHSMGGERFTTSAQNQESNAVNRLLYLPSTDTIAARGKLQVDCYKKSALPGLKGINIRELVTVSDATARSVKNAIAPDVLWSSARRIEESSAPSWNGFMRSCIHTGEISCSITAIEAVPFIYLDLSNRSTIYTALLFAVEECKYYNQGSRIVTFDQPLYAKASEIIAASPPGELDSVTLRLDRFHLLVSFMGSIGFIMSGSGIEELWILMLNIQEHSPWDVDCLRSLASGVVGDDSINCDQAEYVGLDAVKRIIGSNFGEVKLTQKNRVKPLSAVARSILIRDDVVEVNFHQLFMQIVCVMKTENDLKHYISYELSPRPPALFDEVAMRKTVKSAFLQLFSYTIPEENSTNDPRRIVIDGGHLLHALERLITLLSRHFETAGIEVCNSEGDADTLIVKRALELASVGNNVTVVASDTDTPRPPLVMLLARATDDMELRVLSPAKKVYFSVMQLLVVTHNLLSLEKCKKKAWRILQRPYVRNATKVFNSLESTKEEHTCSIAKEPVAAAFELATLPPTNATSAEHSLRTYYHHLSLRCAWFPVVVRQTVATECECRRARLACSTMSGHRRGGSCMNIKIQDFHGSDDEDDPEEATL